MEANLLPYLVAHMAIRPNQVWDLEWDMATLISSRIAVTPAHAVPSGPVSREGPHVFWLDFPQSPRVTHDVRVTPEVYDHDVDFAVLKLDKPLEMPTASPVISAEPVEEGAPWETLCLVAPSVEAIPVHGRVEGIEIVDSRSLIKLSVDNPPVDFGVVSDFGGVSGAPVMVNGKVIGIVWGIRKAERNDSSKAGQSSKERPGYYWYAVPISAMIESKKTDAIRKLLDQDQGSRQDGPLFNESPAALPTRGEYTTDEIMARLRDGKGVHRGTVVQALGTQGISGQHREIVITLLASDHSEVRAAAVGALRELVGRDAEVRDAVLKLLDDKDSTVRAEALKAFAGVSRNQIISAALARRLEDEDSTVREAAAAALSAAVADAHEAGSEEAEVPASPPSGDDSAPIQNVPDTSLESASLDPVTFFSRLSPAARRALSQAAGIERYLMRRSIESMGSLSQEERSHLEQRPPEPLGIVLLVAGLFDDEEGPTRRLFLSKNIDSARLVEIIDEAGEFRLPSRQEYFRVKLTNLPLVNAATQRALETASDIADKMGSAQIQSRHLLYGVLSIKDSKLVNLLADSGVRQEDVPLTEAPAEASTLQTIARLNSDNAEGEDLLGIDGDVNALSSVIAARDVATPLSIGLFGDWGSGKSFFMGKLRKRIFELRDTARAAGGKSAYCDNVVQIEFNAWSYQEGDLWASLVTDIFESLAQSIDDDAGLSQETEQAAAKARLLASMASAGDVLAEQERKRDAAEKELQAGEQQFEALKKIGPKDVIREAYRAAAAEPEVKKGLDAAADQLNIPEAERALGDLKVELLEIKHLWSAIPLAFKGWNRPRDWIIALAVMAAVVLIAWVAVPLVLHFKLDSATGSIVAFLSLALGRLAPVLKRAKAVTATIKGIRDSQRERIEKQQEQMRKKLDDAELRVQHAKENLQNLEQSLQEMRADTRLLNFVRQRRLSTDYTSRLGTVARARRDFKQLSDLMDQARLEYLGQTTQSNKTEVTLGLPRIDRIVLYIDDLDRCSEDKVVKVLEAVHLLLAFKLFVVIVAVDSRWLLHSLRQHSAAFQTSNKGAGISDEEDAHWESTPLNYLEKIFQIPFYLRPMRARGFDRVVHTVIGEVLSESAADAHLAKPSGKVDGVPAIQRVPERQPQQVTQAGRDDKAQVAPDATLKPAPTAEVASAVSFVANETSNQTAKGGSSDRVDAEIHGADIQTQTEAPTVKKEQAPAGSLAEANPAALQLREWERDFMAKLHPLIRSPRSAKRFINIYRLMRVSITNERDLEAFVGNRHGGQHRAALLLLAILTGYPAEATDILRDLLEEERPETWWQYIDGIEAKWISPKKPSSGSGLLSTQRRRDLMDKLRLLRREIPETQSCDQFVKWASKVARYSFESGRVLALTNDETDTD